MATKSRTHFMDTLATRFTRDAAKLSSADLLERIKHAAATRFELARQGVLPVAQRSQETTDRELGQMATANQLEAVILDAELLRRLSA